MKRLAMFTLALMVLMMTLLGTAKPASASWDCEGLYGWYGIHFTKELPAGYWAAGTHNYEYYLHDSSVGTWDYFIESFNSDPAAPLYSGQAFLRYHSVRTSAGTVTSINPAQDTLFQVTYLLSDDYAVAEAIRSTLYVWLRWDGGSWIELQPSRMLKWCDISPDAPHHWTRIWDYDY